MSSGSSAAQLNSSVPSITTSKSILSLKNKKLVALVLGLLVVLGLVYYFVVRPRMSEGYQDTTDSNSKPKLILYWASWCGHSNAFKGTWDNFTHDKVDKDTVNCDDNTKCKPGEDGVPEVLKGYPSVFFKQPDGDYVEFEGPRTEEGLRTFIDKQIP